MTKSALVDELLARRAQLSRRQAELVVDTIFETLSKALAAGRRVEIRGFGVFGVKERGPRQGRNPKTGELVHIAARRVPFFRAGEELRMEVNGRLKRGGVET